MTTCTDLSFQIWTVLTDWPDRYVVFRILTWSWSSVTYTGQIRLPKMFTWKTQGIWTWPQAFRFMSKQRSNELSGNSGSGQLSSQFKIFRSRFRLKTRQSDLISGVRQKQKKMSSPLPPISLISLLPFDLYSLIMWTLFLATPPLGAIHKVRT